MCGPCAAHVRPMGAARDSGAQARALGAPPGSGGARLLVTFFKVAPGRLVQLLASLAHLPQGGIHESGWEPRSRALQARLELRPRLLLAGRHAPLLQAHARRVSGRRAGGVGIGYVDGSLQMVEAMLGAITGCERILRTPCPPGYVGVLRMVMVTFLIMLPNILIETLHWYMIPVVSISAFAILAVEEVRRAWRAGMRREMAVAVYVPTWPREGAA